MLVCLFPANLKAAREGLTYWRQAGAGMETEAADPGCFCGGAGGGGLAQVKVPGVAAKPRAGVTRVFYESGHHDCSSAVTCCPICHKGLFVTQFLVTGVAGFIGRSIAAALLARGEWSAASTASSPESARTWPVLKRWTSSSAT